MKDHLKSAPQAVVAELGVALVPKILVATELASGQLVELFDQPIIESKTYYLAYPRERGFPAAGRLPRLAARADSVRGTLKPGTGSLAE